MKPGEKLALKALVKNRQIRKTLTWDKSINVLFTLLGVRISTYFRILKVHENNFPYLTLVKMTYDMY